MRRHGDAFHKLDARQHLIKGSEDGVGLSPAAEDLVNTRRVLPFIRRINQNDVGGAAQALGRVEAGEGRADDDYARHRGICACLGQPQEPAVSLLPWGRALDG